MSQEAHASEAGLHRTFAAHVERQARNISLDNIERLAKAFNVPRIKWPPQLSQKPVFD